MLVIMLVTMPLGQALAWHGNDDARGPGPLADGTPWYDPLDDSSYVYVPPGGLVGVEVSGGNAHLLPGHDVGWVASAAIPCPDGYRYDLVVLEVDTPGDSWVNVTVLDPSKAPTDASFANATVPGFVNLTGTDVSVFRVPVSKYPAVRIQVTLHASGTDRPRLLSWSLEYIELGIWRDDFAGPGKMSELSGINITSGQVTLDLTETTGGEGEPYPPVLFPDSRGDVDIFFGNANQDGYLDGTTIASTTPTRGMDSGDLNGDGHMDIILARDGGSGSMVLWGSDPGKWSTASSLQLSHTDSGTDAAIGDFNGDGHLDFVISAVGGMIHDGSYVWYNKGDGTFNKTPDRKLEGGTGHVDAGDLNEDGYDDIVLTKSLVMDAPCYYGSSTGPSNSPDLNFLRGITMTAINQVLIEDVDGDDHLDVLFAVIDNKKVPIYLGSASGPDTTADHSLDVNAVAWDVAAGDVNGDGYVDLAYTTGDAGGRNGRIEIFKGNSTGWSATDKHTILMGPDPNPIELVDVNEDDHDDILCGESASFKVFEGGTTWPTAADITKQGLQLPGDMTIASSSGGGGTFSGHVVTEPIPVPADQLWDVLYLDADAPPGTEVAITVLDSTGDPVSGYEGLPGPAVDIRGIGQWGSIHVRVDMTSQDNATTPVLRSLLVNWHGKFMWRDQFYGDIKAESTLNLGTSGLNLHTVPGASDRPDLVFASLRSDNAYDTKSVAFMDAGGLDYLSTPPVEFNTRGATAIDAHDINDDGIPDLAVSSAGSGPGTPDGSSWVFLGSPAGWYDVPYHTFSTTAAMDVLLDDLDGDGYADVVLAQQLRYGQDNPSLLFWGSEDGWGPTPDVEFNTTGANSVEAVDLDDDDLLDLVFACEFGDSLLFYQEAAGFCGTVPSHRFSTVRPSAVGSGDLDGDGNQDLVFANYFDGSEYSIDSHVYWGQGGRGFGATPGKLPTMGATDVAVSDLDGDSDLDVVFANGRNATNGYKSEAGIYINDGTGGLTTTAMHYVGIDGASAVAVVDLDGRGVMDLVFACSNNGTGYRTNSMVYVSSSGSWPFEPTALLPTVGAVDVLPVHLSGPNVGGYLSEAITPDPSDDPGEFHTISYTLARGEHGPGIQVLDADTGEPLTVNKQMAGGSHEWDVRGLFSYREHPSIRLLVSARHDPALESFTVDDLIINWTERMPVAPQVVSASISDTSVHRGGTVHMTVNATDEFDPPGDLEVTVEHRLEGEDAWKTYLLGDVSFKDGLWNVTVAPDRFVPTGNYTFRVNVTDSDGLFSGHVQLAEQLEVLANLPRAPNLLRATAGNGMVELEWRAPLDTGDRPLDGYRVLRGTSSVDLAVIATVDSFADTYQDAGLTNGVTYHYAVVGYNDLGDSPWSQVLNATPLGVPGIPVDLTVTAGDGNATLSWSPPALDGGSPLLGYRVFRGVLDGPLEEIASTGDVTGYLDEGLTNGVEYNYALLAFNEQGDGLRTSVVAVVPMGLPDAPTDLQLEVGVMTLTLSWEAPLETGGSPVTGFLVYRGTSGDDLELIQSMPASALEFVDDGLTAGTTYHYAVSAETSAGEGPASPVVSATAMDLPGVPGDLIAEAGDGVVNLTWSAPSDGGSPITGYVVVRTSGGATETFEVGAVTSYGDTAVTNGETYVYRVRARTAMGDGQASSEVEATPVQALYVPGKVPSLNVVAKGTRVTLTWTAPADDGGSPVTGYVILRGESPENMEEIGQVALVTSYVDEDVRAGTTYHYSVKAVNAVGEGDPADGVQVKVKDTEADDDEFPALIWVGILLMLLAVFIGVYVRPRLGRT